jgi:hypothetical protein
MTTSDQSTRTPGLLDTVYEMVSSVSDSENEKRSIEFHLYTPTKTFRMKPMLQVVVVVVKSIDPYR